MTETQNYTSQVVIAGGGLAGLTTAHELLDRGHKVLVLDRDVEQKLGGLAKESFGGVHMIGTPHQKKMGIRDSVDLAIEDWWSYANFGEGDDIPQRWARFYCENSVEYIFEFLDGAGVEFLPLVNWPERGIGPPWQPGPALAYRLGDGQRDHREGRRGARGAPSPWTPDV